jgi:hypothetical protein
MCGAIIMLEPGEVHHGVAVGLGAHRLLEADVAVAAGLVLDQEGLAERLGEPRAEHAGGDVGDAARRHVDDHAHRLGGPGLRVGICRDQRRGQRYNELVHSLS